MCTHPSPPLTSSYLPLSFLPQTWCNELNAVQPLNRGSLYSVLHICTGPYSVRIHSNLKLTNFNSLHNLETARFAMAEKYLTIAMTSIRSISACTFDRTCWAPALLQDVLYVTCLQGILLSVLHMAHRSYELHFAGDDCHILDNV